MFHVGDCHGIVSASRFQCLAMTGLFGRDQEKPMRSYLSKVSDCRGGLRHGVYSHDVYGMADRLDQDVEGAKVAALSKNLKHTVIVPIQRTPSGRDHLVASPSISHYPGAAIPFKIVQGPAHGQVSFWASPLSRRCISLHLIPSLQMV